MSLGVCYVGRGLFEKDKLVFSFMLCVEVMRLEDLIQPGDWNYFLRGATGASVDVPAKPNVAWLQQWQWADACRLDAVLPDFKGLRADVTTTPCWVQFGDGNVVRPFGQLPKADLGFLEGVTLGTRRELRGSGLTGEFLCICEIGRAGADIQRVTGVTRPG